MTDQLDKLQQDIKIAVKTSVISEKKAAVVEMESRQTGFRAGGELIGGILGGLMFGYFADHMFDTKPLCMVIGLFVGVAAGFYGVYRVTKDS